MIIGVLPHLTSLPNDQSRTWYDDYLILDYIRSRESWQTHVLGASKKKLFWSLSLYRCCRWRLGCCRTFSLTSFWVLSLNCNQGFIKVVASVVTFPYVFFFIHAILISKSEQSTVINPLCANDAYTRDDTVFTSNKYNSGHSDNYE